MPQPYLSVVIPAYNEAERLPATLVDADRYLSAAGFTYEIIVADDGSKDATPEVVNRMAKQIKHLRILRFDVNRGKGAVVRDGMLNAEGRYRIFMDADNSTALDHFEKMRPLFKNVSATNEVGAAGSDEKYDVLIGSRAHKDSRLEPPEPWYRQIPGKLGNLLWIQPLVLWGLWDTQCGFKGFTAEAAERIFRLTRITGWGFDIEALSLARKLGYRIGEIPVLWVNDPNSKVSASAYLKVFIETVKIRLWLWSGKYDLKGEGNVAHSES